jgi:5-methylcytosine-specific restriction endonuclease McrBC regulatory subunit McrC
LGIKNILINGYSGDYLLSNNLINQQPDYLLEMKDSKKSIITDAKWKLFDITENKNREKINISSGDVYQIFSYLHYYKSKNIAYIFAPKTEDFNDDTNLTEPLEYLEHDSKSDKKIRIIPINLEELINNSHILNENILNEKVECAKNAHSI